MKKYLLSFAVVFGLMCNFSCRMNVLKGEGNKTTTTPDVTSFNAVVIDISLKSVVNVQAGTQPAVQLSGYENLLKHIKTKVENNTLRIYSDLDDTWRMESGDVTAQITLPAIAAFTLNGAGDVGIHGGITGSSFKLELPGAGDVKIDSVSADNFSIMLEGAGDIHVNGGSVKNAEVEVDGTGDVKAIPLQAAEAKATVNGAGDIEISALQKLTANINGAGSVKYKGHPTVSKEVSGAGSVTEAH